MSNLHARDIIYDWNAIEKRVPLTNGPFELYDETLRDGIQCPSALDPAIEDKLRLIHLMNSMGIHWANIGLPGAGPRAVADTTRIAQEIVSQKLSIRPSCAARTHVNDVQPIIDISQKIGAPIEVMAFIGASPIRRYAEDWDLDRMLSLISSSISLGVKAGLRVTFVTEDTIRSRPQTLATLFRCAIDHGASRLCLCDTVGHATPDGVRNLIHFTRNLIRSLDVEVGIDWHGHNDRGLALTNALSALEYGADRVHGTALGIGERVGNTSMDQLLINLKLLGELDTHDLSSLNAYTTLASSALGMPIPRNYPVFGEDAFKTATGVHAAAIIKAQRKGDAWLADRIYSGVPAHWVGKSQEIEVGPMSGLSNVTYWLSSRGLNPDPTLAQALFAAVKQTSHIWSAHEIEAFISRWTPSA
jgi:2-isopropylmalate synthase